VPFESSDRVVIFQIGIPRSHPSDLGRVSGRRGAAAGEGEGARAADNQRQYDRAQASDECRCHDLFPFALNNIRKA